MNKDIYRDAVDEINPSSELIEKTKNNIIYKKYKSIFSKKVVAVASLIILICVGFVFNNTRVENSKMEKNDMIANVDMTAMVIYGGRKYIATNEEISIEEGRSLLGEFIGEAKGNMDINSKISGYKADFDSTIKVGLYTMKGYEDKSKLLGGREFDDGSRQFIIFKLVED